ncbi:TetR family transcriptional regulator C-terminal domain-containing protein [Variovorax sp. J2P1-59]|uniref:TetR family transcriptional regulator C-terminal domain-containing protein n=1 Tax=Variovorax flavidus TaxID=3053501 RepID=UPI0025772C69|nr:TetR family transcriptional regulator C-terminal domain-containing protein [Variovorax sp. J2P1-59]MDM0073237.1 TetR family transcriptional regulator C-terminal domain-containing protein [Variovorax sp. J2P1-59]
MTRYDEVTAEAASFDELMEGFTAGLAETVRKDASMHRLWYDLRAQSLFEPAFRADVAEIDKSLERMIWRVLSRFADLAGAPVRVPSSVAYAMFDGLFQQCLLKHLAGDRRAVAVLRSQVRLVVGQLVGTVAGEPARRARRSRATHPSERARRGAAASPSASASR